MGGTVQGSQNRDGMEPYGADDTDREDHAGLAGSFQLLRLREGDTVGHNEVQLTSRLISHPKEVQIHEIRNGIIRAQALTPRESLAFIEKVLGET